MKRLFTSLALAALSVATVSALDVSARVYMSGSLADGYYVDNGTEKGNPWNFITVNNQDQKDDDALQLSMSSEKAGASFRLWYNYTNDGDSETLKARSTVLWFKPVDMVKISVGDVGQYLYTEQLDWWRDPLGGSYAEWESWAKRYSNQTGLETRGIQLDLTPIEGLTVQLGAGANGSNTTFFSNSSDGKRKYLKWGATAKYQISDSISAGVGYRDEGSDDTGSTYSPSFKLITAGVDFGNAWTKPYYAFIQPRFMLDYNTQSADAWSLDGIMIDNYFKFNVSDFKIEGRLPFCFRLTGEDNDPNWFCYELKAKYLMNDTFEPYIKLASDHTWKADNHPICLGSEKGYRIQDTFYVDTELGSGMKFGAAEVYAALEFYTTPVYISGAKYSDKWWGWAIPFSCSVKM